MHLDTTYLRSLKTKLHKYAQIRRDVITEAGNALHTAKRVIFALHRGDKKEAETKLAAVERAFLSLQKRYKYVPEIHEEGSYRAALEEYVEAKLLHQFLSGRKITRISELSVPTEIYLAGLCDVPGELYRYAIRAATEGDLAMVDRCTQAGEDIIGALTEFDLTKYLRTKFDQAKHAAQKLEIVRYEVRLRK